MKEINNLFLLPLNIDFGIRSIRQSMNYSLLLFDIYPTNFDYYDYENDFPSSEEESKQDEFFNYISLNSILIQKVFPRFIFDGNEITKNGKTKLEVVVDFQEFLTKKFEEFYSKSENTETNIGKSSNLYLKEMIEQANRNNSQFNFFA
jgi:hypothetical protein